MKKSIRHLKSHPLNAEIYQLSGIEELADSIDWKHARKMEPVGSKTRK